MTGGALVVAAGYARRFGGDKRLYLLQNREPMLVATLRSYCAAFPNVAVVVRNDDSRIARLVMKEFQRNPPLVITTDQASFGMAHSLADGVRTLSGWDYLFIGLGDMPFVRVDSLKRLDAEMRDARHEACPCVVVPQCGDTPGHPVGFSCDFFGELVALSGDRGARAVVERHADVVITVSLDDPGVLQDVDAPAEAR